LLTGLGLSSCAELLGDVVVESRSVGVLEDGGLPMLIGGNQPTCEAGDVRCNQSLLETCVRVDIARPNIWVPRQECLTADLCIEGPARCVTPACGAGDVSCQGATPRVCNPGRTGWVDLESCESSGHCSTQAAQCSEGAPCCLAAPCQAGELRCNQEELQRCNESASDWDTVASCGTAELCTQAATDCASTGSCACPTPVCGEGETRCTEGSLERCNAGRSGWDVVQQCATAELCERSRELVPLACEPPACAPGENVCTPEGVLQTCSNDRTSFVDLEECEGPPFCNAAQGLCEPARCDAGEASCNGAQIQVCNEDRTGFDTLGEPCASAALCNDGDPANVRCDPPVCGPGQVNCFGSNQLQACNDGLTGFEPSGPACLRPDLCSAERRRCDFCVPGRQECTVDQTSSRTCALSGNLFGPLTFCPLGCIPASGTCVTCAIGTYTCQGASIARCNDGRSFTPLNRTSDCAGPTQFTCTNGTPLPRACGAPGCNVFSGTCNECTPGQRRCTGNDTFQQCGINGTFGPEDECGRRESCEDDGECVDNGNGRGNDDDDDD
jgi:hypothetical protein